MTISVTHVCRSCDQANRHDLAADATQVLCQQCGAEIPLVTEHLHDNTVDGCVLCGCREMFVRKDFSQRLGVTIVVVGFLLSTIAWGFHWRYVSYAILFATALIDVILYFTVRNLLQCYRCRAEYRGLTGLEVFEPFDLETHERFRQQAIRMAEAKRAAG